MSEADQLVIGGPRPLRGRLRVPGRQGDLAPGAAVRRARGRHAAGSRTSRPATTSHATRAALAHARGCRARRSRRRGRRRRRRSRRAAPSPTPCSTAGTPARRCGCSPGCSPAVRSSRCSPATRRCAHRPMGRVVDPLRAMGAHGRRTRRRRARAARRSAAARSRGARHELAVASGQVKTALVLAGLQADGTTEIVEPAPSRDHTERMLAALGAPLVRIDDRTLRVHAGARRAVRARRARAIRRRPRSSSSPPRSRPAPSIVLEDVSLNPAPHRVRRRAARMGADIEVRPRRRAAAASRSATSRCAPRRCTAPTIAGDEVRSSTRSRRSRSRPRSPTASPRSATRPSCG